MANYVQVCKPSQGWAWLIEGINHFKRSPLDWFILGNTYIFMMFVLSLLVPLVGVAILSPAFTLGAMMAGKMSKSGLRFPVRILFSAFTPDNRKYLKRLLILGGANAFAVGLVGLIGTLVLGTAPNKPFIATESGINSMDREVLEYFLNYAMLTSVLSLPIVATFWFAPVMVAWHNMEPMRALFSSWMAVWRNKQAFIIYGMGWILLASGFFAGGVAITSLLGAPNGFVGALNIMMLAALMGATMATYQVTYRDIFEHDPGLDVVV